MRFWVFCGEEGGVSEGFWNGHEVWESGSSLTFVGVTLWRWRIVGFLLADVEDLSQWFIDMNI